MTNVFSWMLAHTVGQIRFVLVGDVLIRMDHRWNEDWVVRSTTQHPTDNLARHEALAKTQDMENGGFKLSGSVCMVAADVKPNELYVENHNRELPGPLLRNLFLLTWTDL